ncbi:DUF6236 family protein [Streptomyces tropicalis]|uniref:DUF6236 family protein n=1 Tax=Streptomyces tropicalis TaxID=3034234 RepID=A0ABT6AE48_9ACTN|nr:DUF6236 family protein [Streptomyces tropicalis]MDF3302921.1 DUF6236 family protein [Streptomyces tropicalis]
MRETITALWEPDVSPPVEWLKPAILYQDKVATFAPEHWEDGADKTAAHRLRTLLGSIYSPLSLSSALIPDGLVDVLRGKLPHWRGVLNKWNQKENSEWIESWLRRTDHHERASRNSSYHALIRTGQAEDARLSAEASSLQRQFDRKVSEIGALESQLKDMRRELQPILTAKRERNRLLFAPVMRARNEIIYEMESGPEREAVLRRNDTEIEEARRHIEPLPQEDQLIPFYSALDRFTVLARERHNLRRTLRETKSRLAACRRTTDRARYHLAMPWLRPESQMSLVGLPEHLSTLSVGKIGTGRVFEFLATEAGMWFVPHSGGPWAGTLIGPTNVIRDVLAALAEWHCSQNPDWVLMSTSQRMIYGTSGLLSEEADTSLVISQLLPVPERGSLEEIVDFRRSHEAELRTVREEIAGMFSDFSDLESLDEVTRQLKDRLKEPLEEIEASLRHRKNLGTRNIARSAAFRALGGVRNIGLGAVTATVAVPVFGETWGIQGAAAGTFGGAVLATGAMAARIVRSAHALQASQTRLHDSPYRYVYQLGRQFGLEGAV